MPQFHETRGGRMFFDRQLPALIKAINGMEEQLKVQNELTKRMLDMMEKDRNVSNENTLETER